MINKSYREQINAIKNDVRKSYDGIVKDLSKQAKKDLTSAAFLIINDFYDSYTPMFYKRKHNLYNMVIPKTIEKYGENNAYIASVSTMSVVMDDIYGKTSKANITPDDIYNLMWNAGHRGLPYQTLPSWYPEIEIDGNVYSSNTPHNEMKMFVNKWGKDIGSKKINTIDKKYKSKNYISFN